MNVVLLPNWTFMGELEQVPGAQRVACMICKMALTATPTSLDAVKDGGGFLCRECGETVMPYATVPLRMPEGAGDELRAVGLGHIADDDERLLRRLQGKHGHN